MRSYLLPHVPYLLPELGGIGVKKYLQSIYSTFEEIKIDLATDPPDCILICSPHYEGNSFKIGHSMTYKGDLSNFNKPEIVDLRTGSKVLSEYIQQKGEEIGFLPAPGKQENQGFLDYGSIVPLRLIDPGSQISIIPISISLGSKREHFIWGTKLAEICESYSSNVVFLASTELTQDFNQDVLAFPSNSEEDKQFINHLLTCNYDAMSNFPTRYFNNTERELLPVFVLAGFSEELTGTLLDYTGFVGCGCACVQFD